MEDIEIIKINQKQKIYPKILRKTKDAPRNLYLKGNINLLEKTAIAIVGSRKPSVYGMKMTEKFVKRLTESGLVIVSGLAMGIDSIAHRCCLENGGKTIAILGSGIENLYPKQNEELAEIIIQTGGLIISEYPPKQEKESRFFQKRNRIISGLSIGTLVVEAKRRSGTQITAQYCIEQKRKLYLIPHNIDNVNGEGIRLLKSRYKNSIEIENPDEIINNIGIYEKVMLEPLTKEQIDFLEQIRREQKNDAIRLDEYRKRMELKKEILEEKRKTDNQVLESLSNEERKIYKLLLKYKQLHINEISKIIDMRVEEVGQILTLLEIEGVVHNLPGNKYEIA